MDKPEQFDSDGRDPELIEFWKSTMRFSGEPFRREDVPEGISFADFWREVIHGADSVSDCVERLRAYIEHRPPVSRIDSHLTITQKWMRWKRKQKRDAETALRHYVQERESERWPNDEFVRFMKKVLQPTKPPSSTSDGNQQ